MAGILKSKLFVQMDARQVVGINAGDNGMNLFVPDCVYQISKQFSGNPLIPEVTVYIYGVFD